MRRLPLILAALLVTACLAACGQKGPLKLPPDAGSAPPKTTPNTGTQ